MKKIIVVALSLVSLFALTACGSSSSDLTIFLYQDGIIYNEDMRVFKLANEYAEVELSGVLQKSDTNYDTIFNLNVGEISLAVNAQETIEEFALTDGIYTDLTDLIAEYAPNLTAYWEANPEQKEWATASDGAIYGIPFYTDGETAKGYFVRQDWIDILSANNKLGSIDAENLDDLTVEQYEELLQAFKDNKSLLTTADNIYPYFDDDYENAISELASLWGGTADFYIDADGNVVHGATQTEFKEALENIQRWYANGLIDPNILISSTEDKRVTFFAQNSGGSTHDWIGSTDTFNADYYASNLVDDFNLVCIAPPTRADGTKYEPTTRKEIGMVTAINSRLSQTDQIKLVKWIDFFFSAEGSAALNFGIEGTDYNVVDGEYVYTNTIINESGTALQNLYNIGAQMQTPGVQTFAYEEAWLSSSASQAMNKYEVYLNAGYNDLIYPNMKLSKDDYKTVNTAKSAIATVYETQINKWVKGTEQINDSTWNSFVEALEKAGSSKVVSIFEKYI